MLDKIEKNKKNMEKFYNEISEKYDYIFPLNEMQKNFFEEILKEVSKNNTEKDTDNIKIENGLKILDVGAATGNLTSYLKEKGLSIKSIDINEKLIIQAKNKGIKIDNLNMLEIDKLNDKFDMIINIGNTLPHLHSLEEVKLFLEKSYLMLKNNGKLVIQMINFHKFLQNKKESSNYLGFLPLIENENVKFERFYYLSEDENIIFKTILDGKFQNEEVLLNIDFYTLKEFLEKIGFKEIEVFGGFNKDKFDFENSMFLVIICEK